MEKWKLVCIGLLLMCAGAKAQNSYEGRVRAYIGQYRELAMEEQRLSGVPAAITLAQGIHETSAGNSVLATEANNHFGIKCKKEWRGKTFAHTDDAPDECFRKYKHYMESFKDHSDYLKNSPRYAVLFTLKPTDYAGWAAGLKRCGYATNPRYAQVLTKLIEDYHLQDYTIAALSENSNPVKESINAEPKVRYAATEIIPENDAPVVPNVTPAPAPKMKVMKVVYTEPSTQDDMMQQEADSPEYDKIVIINGLKAYYARKGTTLLNDALKHNMRYGKLLDYNDLQDAPLAKDMYIYLEKKLTKGLMPLYVVKPGETMADVSQETGVQLRYLMFYNRIAANEEPVDGSLIHLQEYTDEKPETYVKASKNEAGNPFVGSNPNAIPQGSTRMRRGFENVETASIEKVPPKQVIIAPETKPVAIKKWEPDNEMDEKEGPESASSSLPPEVTIVEKEIAVVPFEEKPIPQKTEEQQATELKREVAATKEIIEETSVTISSPEENKHSVQAIFFEENAPPVIEKEIVAATPEEKAPNIPTIILEAPAPPVVLEKEALTKVEKEEVIRTPVINAEATASPVLSQENSPEKTEAEKALREMNAPQQETKNEEEEMYVKVEEVVTKKEIAPEKIPEIIAQPEPSRTAENIARIENVVPTEMIENDLDMAVPATATPVKVPVVNTVPPKVEDDVPMDEFAKLKAKLDKVVYASDKPVATTPKTAAPEPKKETPAKPTATAPKTEKPAKETVEKPAKETGDKQEMYTVKKGDTAFSIAKSHHITMRQLLDWNKLDFQAIKPGMKLRVK